MSLIRISYLNQLPPTAFSISRILRANSKFSIGRLLHRVAKAVFLLSAPGPLLPGRHHYSPLANSPIKNKIFVSAPNQFSSITLFFYIFSNTNTLSFGFLFYRAQSVVFATVFAMLFFLSASV